MTGSGKSGRDVTVFVVSLLLAFSIWLIHNLSLSYSMTLRSVVTACSNIPGRYQTSLSPVTIEARCRTTGFNLIRSHREERKPPKQVWIDPQLFNHVADDQFTVSANELSGYVTEIFGQDVRLESFVSPSVTFRFAAENNRKVPVHVVRSITYRPQYTSVGDIRISPDSVMIYGDGKYIDHFDRILTKPLTLSGVSNSRTGTISLEEPKGIRLSETEVAYDLEVSRYVEIRSRVKVGVRGVPAGRTVDVYPSVADVVMKCSFPVTGDPAGQLRLFVDYREFQNSRSGKCLARTSSLPSGVISVEVEPEVFECVER